VSQTVLNPPDEMSAEARRLVAELEQAHQQSVARGRRRREIAAAAAAVPVQLTLEEAA
jgi:hypothetical protein